MMSAPADACVTLVGARIKDSRAPTGKKMSVRDERIDLRDTRVMTSLLPCCNTGFEVH